MFGVKPTIEVARFPRKGVVRPDPSGRGGTNGIYKVTQLLPPQGDDHQYRIKNADEPHERVIKESQLDRIA